MREKIVGKTAAARQPVRALDFHRHGDKPGGRIFRVTIGAIALDAFLRAAECDTGRARVQLCVPPRKA